VLNSDKNVEVSDTMEGDSNSKAGNKKSMKKLNDFLKLKRHKDQKRNCRRLKTANQ